MTKFRLKISSNNIEVYQDKNKIGEGDDYKELLAFIAYIIDDDDIDSYEVWLHEKGNSEKLEDFDPEVILEHSPKSVLSAVKKSFKNSDSSNDDDDDDNHHNIKSSNSSREETHKSPYIPKYKPDDYKKIGLSWQAALNNSMGKE